MLIMMGCGLLVVSCNSGLLEIELPDQNSEQIVMYGFVDTAGAEIQLARAGNPNDTFFLAEDRSVGGALVAITNLNTGEQISLRDQGNGRYTSMDSFQSDASYTVSATVPGYGEIMARDIEIPLPLLSSELLLTNLDLDTNNVIRANRISASIALSYLKYPSFSNGITLFNLIGEGSVNGRDRISPDLLEEITVGCGFQSGALLVWPNDCYVNTDEVTIPILVRQEIEGSNAPDSLLLRLSVVQKIFVDNVQSLNINTFNFDNIFIEANTYQSNISGGLGVVSGRSFSEHVVPLR
ncbi:DUF4249 domain-containing protein [Neolewinella antarctica]|uniref:DUF4249 family protein n=1 Tax=Neolewinella antarctica TaxID=442734 RepID=UPI001439CC81|nr:DUF4249 family protein [Neolewinella antarctica]